MGAMFFSYALAMAVFVPLYVLIWFLLPGVNLMIIGFGCLVAYLPLTPFVFRYARALWLYWDRWGSPSEVSTPTGWADFQIREEIIRVCVDQLVGQVGVVSLEPSLAQ